MVQPAVALRAAFLAAGWTVDGLYDLLGPAASGALAREEVGTVLRRLDQPDVQADPRSVLTRLFVLNRPVPRDALAAVIPLEAAVDLGLVAVEPTGEVTARFEVRPYGQEHDGRTDHWYVVSDHAALTFTSRRALHPDHVLGVGGASMTLASLTPRLRVDRALDIGTGCGVQALHLAGHAASVVATDLSQRAIDCARITFALSGIGVDARVGSLLEPVADETFDLIVANPPFVISPRATHTYRDGGFPADSLGAQLCRDLPARLNAGGTALLLANWLHVRDESWVDRVEGWVRETGCDAWIVERERTDPAAYVDMWLSDSAERDDEDHQERLTQWLDHFDALNVDAIGFGWILLRRSDSDPVVHIEDARTAPRQPDGAEVAAAMDRIVVSQRMSAAETLTTAWQVSPRAIVQTRNALTAGAPLGDGLTTVELDSDWREPIAISATLLDVLRSCDGASTLNDLIDDDEALVEALIGVRQLHLRGVLHPR